jgi:ankyrin repeat protein
LSQGTPAEAEAAAQSIQFDLSLAYAKMLSRISVQGLRLLQWVFFTKRTLSLEELRLVIAIKTGMRDLDTKRQLPFPSFIDWALGLLVVDHHPWGSTVRFAHLTIKDYLSEHISQYFPDGYGLLARTCLTYLNFTALSSDVGRSRFLNGGDLFIFFWHTSSQWGDYVREAENDTEICDMAVEWLLSERFQQLLYLRSPISRYQSLHESCHFGLVSVTVKLLELGHNINALDTQKMTPLHYAVRGNRSAIVQVLLQFPSIDGNMQQNAGGNVPLYGASEHGNTAIAQTPVQNRDVQINLQDDRGRTALHHAVNRGHSDIVHLLLEHPALNVNLADKDGQTALTIAVRGVHVDIIRHLLAHREINISASRVGEPGVLESMPFRRGRIMSLPNDLRLQLGIKLSLYLAAREGDAETVKAFLQQPKPELNARYGEYKLTALHEAAERGHLSVVQTLLLHPEVEVNATDRQGWTALMYAAVIGHSDVLKALLQHQETNVNSANKGGWTALTFAADNEISDIVKILIQHSDTNVNQANNRGRTALTIAADRGCAEIVQMLLAHKDIDIEASRVSVPGFWELNRDSWLSHKHMSLPEDLIAQLGIHPCLFTDLEINVFCGNDEALLPRASGVAVAGPDGK